jgi:hypothetical protein
MMSPFNKKKVKDRSITRTSNNNKQVAEGDTESNLNSSYMQGMQSS